MKMLDYFFKYFEDNSTTGIDSCLPSSVSIESDKFFDFYTSITDHHGFSDTEYFLVKGLELELEF